MAHEIEPAALAICQREEAAKIDHNAFRLTETFLDETCGMRPASLSLTCAGDSDSVPALGWFDEDAMFRDRAMRPYRLASLKKDLTHTIWLGIVNLGASKRRSLG